LKATPDDVGYGGHMSGRALDMRGAPIEVLMATIDFEAGRPIVNDTGLHGRYDIKLQWTQESLFTALKEQLGLQLEAKKGPMKMVVVEHIERPGEN